ELLGAEPSEGNASSGGTASGGGEESSEEPAGGGGGGGGRAAGAGAAGGGGPGRASGRASGKSKTPALDAFGRDLTELARENKLDPVIGRSDEIERVIQILSRRTKNNPVLLGEAGVGKTAIVEGLAQKVVTGEIPELLRNRRIVVLD